MKSLLIIGAGPGGYECALRAAKSGLDVHVVDRATYWWNLSERRMYSY